MAFRPGICRPARGYGDPPTGDLDPPRDMPFRPGIWRPARGYGDPPTGDFDPPADMAFRPGISSSARGYCDPPEFRASNPRYPLFNFVYHAIFEPSSLRGGKSSATKPLRHKARNGKEITDHRCCVDHRPTDFPTANYTRCPACIAPAELPNAPPYYTTRPHNTG